MSIIDTNHAVGMDPALKEWIKNNKSTYESLTNFFAKVVQNEYQECQKAALKSPSEINDWHNNQLFIRGQQAGLSFCFKLLKQQTPEMKISHE